MAHFAQIDENNIVINILVVNNEVITDENGVEQEQIGIDFLKNLYGDETNWAQTSYNSSFRKQYAAIGFTFDPVNEVFISPQPYPSWSLDDNFDWQAPIPRPNLLENQYCFWNEDTLSWEIIVIDELTFQSFIINK